MSKIRSHPESVRLHGQCSFHWCLSQLCLVGWYYDLDIGRTWWHYVCPCVFSISEHAQKTRGSGPHQPSLAVPGDPHCSPGQTSHHFGEVLLPGSWDYLIEPGEAPSLNNALVLWAYSFTFPSRSVFCSKRLISLPWHSKGSKLTTYKLCVFLVVFFPFLSPKGVLWGLMKWCL